MALRRVGSQRVTVKKAVLSVGYVDQVGPLFEQEGEGIRATIQPMNGTVEATWYGEESAAMRLLLTTGRIQLEKGMGVCVERQDGKCDYVIAAPVARWGSYQRAILKSVEL
ncbi:MAG: hypothetical protein PHI98_14940 [Eubacteriales bacterium]|nr:hypothetical protein [Eubacteriales bacterium]